VGFEFHESATGGKSYLKRFCSTSKLHWVESSTTGKRKRTRCARLICRHEFVPNLIPKSLEIPVLVASHRRRAMLAPDRSWTVLLDVTITESRSGWLSKPLLAIHQGRFDL